MTINRQYATYISDGVSTDLISENPVLRKAEMVYETDTGAIRIGDGSTAYSDLLRYYPENSDIDGGSFATQLYSITMRDGTEAEAEAANPTLKSAEMGFETDTGVIRIGDGSTAYTDLPRFKPENQIQNFMYGFGSYNPTWDLSDNTTIADCSDSSQNWAGAVYSTVNGKIYCVPYDTQNILVIDPSDDSSYNIAVGSSGTEKWIGAVEADNKKIYCAPYNATSVLIIDPETDSVDITTISGMTAGGSKYAGIVKGPSGNLFCIPYNAEEVLIINPETDISENTSITSLSGDHKWFSGANARNGYIYCAPFDATTVLIIDPENNTGEVTTITGLSADTGKWAGIIAGPSGNLFCIPYNAAEVAIINPTTNIVDTTTITGIAGSENWIGGSLTPCGDIYCAPYDNEAVLIIDTADNSHNITTITGLAGEDKYMGSVLTHNGKQYCIPFDEDDVLILTSKYPEYPIVPLLSPYTNKL